MVTAELLVVLVAAVLFVALGVRVVREDRRMAVFRLGRYLGIRGPGLVVRLPLIDRTTVVRLDSEVPGWRGMSAEQLNEAVRRRIGV